MLFCICSILHQFTLLSILSYLTEQDAYNTYKPTRSCWSKSNAIKSLESHNSLGTKRNFDCRLCVCPPTSCSVFFGWDGLETIWSIVVFFGKGQLNSEQIYEVIVSPKILTKKYFCLTKTNKDRSTFLGDFLVSLGRFFGYDPCLFGRAEILVILYHQLLYFFLFHFLSWALLKRLYNQRNISRAKKYYSLNGWLFS